jgi:hypothetical protein
MASTFVGKYDPASDDSRSEATCSVVGGRPRRRTLAPAVAIVSCSVADSPDAGLTRRDDEELRRVASEWDCVMAQTCGNDSDDSDPDFSDPGASSRGGGTARSGAGNARHAGEKRRKGVLSKFGAYLDSLYEFNGEQSRVGSMFGSFFRRPGGTLADAAGGRSLRKLDIAAGSLRSDDVERKLQRVKPLPSGDDDFSPHEPASAELPAPPLVATVAHPMPAISLRSLCRRGLSCR